MIVHEREREREQKLLRVKECSIQKLGGHLIHKVSGSYARRLIACSLTLTTSEAKKGTTKGGKLSVVRNDE